MKREKIGLKSAFIIFTSELFDLSGKGCVICFCPDVQNSGFIDNHRSKRLMEERG
jgi:hypothetical protein